MISLDQALERILAHTRPLPGVELPLTRAAGHFLAAPVHARLDQPPFDASAMDGYAVRAADATPDAEFELIGTAQAGSGFSGTVGKGQCVRIFTGAPMPPGADTVIIQENAKAGSGTVRFTASAEPGAHIRNRGGDFFKDGELLEPGALLTPAAIALAAAGNNATLGVIRRPQIAMLATGDELVPPGTPTRPDRIIASIGPGLSALFAPFAETFSDLGIAPDNEVLLARQLKAALDGPADVIITTGGVSVGDHDYVQPVLKSLGVAVDFWKISLKPGKPLMFGTYGHKLVFGLPGNPVSALVTATIVVQPALRALAGDPAPIPVPLRLPLTATLPASGPRRHFMRAKRMSGVDGSLGVLPIIQTDSAHLSSMAAADCLIVNPENGPALPAGTLVDTLEISR